MKKINKIIITSFFTLSLLLTTGCKSKQKSITYVDAEARMEAATTKTTERFANLITEDTEFLGFELDANVSLKGKLTAELGSASSTMNLDMAAKATAQANIHLPAITNAELTNESEMKLTFSLENVPSSSSVTNAKMTYYYASEILYSLIENDSVTTKEKVSLPFDVIIDTIMNEIGDISNQVPAIDSMDDKDLQVILLIQKYLETTDMTAEVFYTELTAIYPDLAEINVEVKNVLMECIKSLKNTKIGDIVVTKANKTKLTYSLNWTKLVEALTTFVNVFETEVAKVQDESIKALLNSELDQLKASIADVPTGLSFSLSVLLDKKNGYITGAEVVVGYKGTETIEGLATNIDLTLSAGVNFTVKSGKVNISPLANLDTY